MPKGFDVLSVKELQEVRRLSPVLTSADLGHLTASLTCCCRSQSSQVVSECGCDWE